MTEHQIQKDCEDYLQRLQAMGKLMYLSLNSGFAFMFHGDKKYKIKLCPKGTADILVIKPCNLNPEVYFLEVKTDKGKQSEAQIKFQEDVELMGCYYRVIRSLDEVMELLSV